MNFMLDVQYPPTGVSQVAKVLTSPQLPPRPDYARELGTIAYTDAGGFHGVTLFEVPEEKCADFLKTQEQRTVFFASRVNGCVIKVHIGSSIPEIMKSIAPLMP